MDGVSWRRTHFLSGAFLFAERAAGAHTKYRLAVAARSAFTLVVTSSPASEMLSRRRMVSTPPQ